MATAGKRTNRHIQRILAALEAGYRPRHARARFDVDQATRWSIRIRVIDPDVASLDPMERDGPIWNLLDGLPEETLQMISLLFVIAPGELKDSPTNQMFESDRAARLARRRSRSGTAEPGSRQ